MTIKSDLILKKIKCGKIALGQGKCFVCRCMVAKRGMTVHHLWYLPDGDVVYKDYPQNDSGRLEYYTELFPLIYNNPKRFMYLCNTCHHSLSKLCMYGDKKFDKLCLARKMTKSYWNMLSKG